VLYPVISLALVALAVIVMALAVSRARDVTQRASEQRRDESVAVSVMQDTVDGRGGLCGCDEQFFDAVSTLHYEVG